MENITLESLENRSDLIASYENEENEYQERLSLIELEIETLKNEADIGVVHQDGLKNEAQRKAWIKDYLQKGGINSLLSQAIELQSEMNESRRLKKHQQRLFNIYESAYNFALVRDSSNRNKD